MVALVGSCYATIERNFWAGPGSRRYLFLNWNMHNANSSKDMSNLPEKTGKDRYLPLQKSYVPPVVPKVLQAEVELLASGCILQRMDLLFYLPSPNHCLPGRTSKTPRWCEKIDWAASTSILALHDKVRVPVPGQLVRRS